MKNINQIYWDEKNLYEHITKHFFSYTKSKYYKAIYFDKEKVKWKNRLGDLYFPLLSDFKIKYPNCSRDYDTKKGGFLNTSLEIKYKEVSSELLSQNIKNGMLRFSKSKCNDKTHCVVSNSDRLTLFFDLSNNSLIKYNGVSMYYCFKELSISKPFEVCAYALYSNKYYFHKNKIRMEYKENDYYETNDITIINTINRYFKNIKNLDFNDFIDKPTKTKIREFVRCYCIELLNKNQNKNDFVDLDSSYNIIKNIEKILNNTNRIESYIDLKNIEYDYDELLFFELISSISNSNSVINNINKYKLSAVSKKLLRDIKKR